MEYKIFYNDGDYIFLGNEKYEIQKNIGNKLIAQAPNHDIYEIEVLGSNANEVKVGEIKLIQEYVAPGPRPVVEKHDDIVYEDEYGTHVFKYRGTIEYGEEVSGYFGDPTPTGYYELTPDSDDYYLIIRVIANEDGRALIFDEDMQYITEGWLNEGMIQFYHQKYMKYYIAIDYGQNVTFITEGNSGWQKEEWWNVTSEGMNEFIDNNVYSSSGDMLNLDEFTMYKMKLQFDSGMIFGTKDPVHVTLYNPKGSETTVDLYDDGQGFYSGTFTPTFSNEVATVKFNAEPADKNNEVHFVYSVEKV